MNRTAAYACLAFAVVCAADAQDTDIDALIRDLGADSGDTRDAALTKLIEIGKPAIPALKKATQSTDLEVSSRAQEALTVIQGQGPDEPAERPARPNRPDMPQLPDMDRVLEDLQKDLDQQMPDMSKMFEQLLKELQNGQGGNEDQGGNSRMRVWTFGNNNSRGGFSGASSELGMGVGSPSAALRSQLEIEGRHGLVVNQLNPGGWGAEHGLQLHDVLVRRDGRPIKNLKDLTPLLQGGQLQLYRKAKLQTITVGAPKVEAPQQGTTPREAPKSTPKKGRNF